MKTQIRKYVNNPFLNQNDKKQIQRTKLQIYKKFLGIGCGLKPDAMKIRVECQILLDCNGKVERRKLLWRKDLLTNSPGFDCRFKRSGWKMNCGWWC